MKLVDASKRYFKGNTHCHTTLSDGFRTPEEVLKIYKDKNYDFLVVSDHWHAFPEKDYEGMLVLCGEEFDFNYEDQVLHLVAIFPNQAASRGFHRGMKRQEVIDGVNAVGGAVIVAHPAWSLNTVEMLKSLKGVVGAEIFNSISGEPWNAPRGDSSAILDLLATAGDCLPQLAADDSHYYEGEECRGFTMVQADALTAEGVIAALKRGTFYASQGPKILDAELTEGRLIVRTSPVCRMNFISNMVWVDERCREGENITEQIYEIQPRDRFIRCEITDKQGRKAWLSPVKL